MTEIEYVTRTHTVSKSPIYDKPDSTYPLVDVGTSAIFILKEACEKGVMYKTWYEDDSGHVVKNCSSRCSAWKRTNESWVCDDCNDIRIRRANIAEFKAQSTRRFNDRVAKFAAESRKHFPDWKPRKSRNQPMLYLEYDHKQVKVQKEAINKLAIAFNLKIRYSHIKHVGSFSQGSTKHCIEFEDITPLSSEFFDGKY